MVNVPLKVRRAGLFLLAAFIPAAILACSDDNGPVDPPPADITGTYALITANGAPLPVPVEEDEEFLLELVGGELVLNQGGTCSGVLFFEQTDKETEDVEEFEEGNDCTYTVEGNEITFNFEGDEDPVLGTIAGETITLTIPDEEIVLAFEKE